MVFVSVVKDFSNIFWVGSNIYQEKSLDPLCVENLNPRLSSLLEGVCGGVGGLVCGGGGGRRES